MIKNTILLSLAAFLFLGCESGVDSTSRKEELKSILTAYYTSLARKDLAKMKDLSTPDFIMFEDGKIYTNETAVKSVEELGNFSVTFQFDSLNSHFDKANASAYYFREAAFTIHDSIWPPMKFLESATFEKREGNWKLRFLHTTLRKG